MRRLLKRLLIALGVLAAVGAAAGYWLLFASNTPSYEGERGVKIPRGSSFAAIGDSLASSGLVRSRRTFELVAGATGWGRQIKPGYYAFESGASNVDLLQRMRRGIQSAIKLTIPPGIYPERLAALLHDTLDVRPDSFLLALRDPAFARRLETDTLHLFSYMLPETYQIYWTTDARGVISRLKDEFDRFYTDEMERKAQALDLTTEQVLRLASIVEWEANYADEKPRIAGVYLNRLRIGMPLQADPTVQYAILEREGRKRRLFNVDYQIAHPFNTYRFAGLPPGPITNPSPSSIRAVVNAERHDFVYFVADGSGRHAFSRTYAEHRRAAERYYALMRQRRDAAAAQAQPPSR